MVYLHRKSVCSELLNSYQTLLSISVSAAKVGIRSCFSASCLGLDASFPICLPLAKAVPCGRCSSHRTVHTGSCFHLTCFCYFVHACADRGVYLFLLLILAFLLNLTVEAAAVCHKVTVPLGLVCASGHCHSILQKSSFAELVA